MHPSPRLTRTEARSSLGFGARVWRQLWRPRDGGVGGRTLVRGRDVPGVWARWDVGHRTRRHLAQVTLVFATHCSSLLRAGGAGCLETRLLVGAAGAFGFLNSLSRFGRGRERKSSWDPERSYSVARGSGWLLSVPGVLRRIPREAIVGSVDTGNGCPGRALPGAFCPGNNRPGLSSNSFLPCPSPSPPFPLPAPNLCWARSLSWVAAWSLFLVFWQGGARYFEMRS